MGDLDKLIAAVEAGTFLMDVFPDGRTERIAYEAFGGSLDAALRLHEALLPGWVWNVVDSETTVWPGYPGDPKDYQTGYAEGRPARAWLLAVLKALQAQPAPLDEPGPVDPRRRG